jgi:dUTPase
MTNQNIRLLLGQWKIVSTGIPLEAPPGTDTKVTPHHTRVVRHGIDIHTGSIDED